MVQLKTNLEVADNSGVKLVQCIKVLGGTGKKCASIGERIKVSVKEVIPSSKIKKGEVLDAVIVRTKKHLVRKDGTVIKFSSNAVVLLTKQGEVIGTSVFGPVSRELRDRDFMKIISLAPEVL